VGRTEPGSLHDILRRRGSRQLHLGEVIGKTHRLERLARRRLLATRVVSAEEMTRAVKKFDSSTRLTRVRKIRWSDHHSHHSHRAEEDG